MKHKKELYVCLLILGILLLCAGGFLSYDGLDSSLALQWGNSGYFLIPFLVIIAGIALIILSITRLAMIRIVFKLP